MSNKKEKAIAIFIAGLFYVTILHFIISNTENFKLNMNYFKGYESELLKAYFNTILVSGIAFILSFIIGVGIFLISKVNNLAFNYIARIYGQVIIGIPLLVHIIIFYFFILPAFGIKNQPFTAGVIILSIYISAYIFQIFESGYQAISPQQFKIMNIYGFTFIQKYRYIVLPQIIRNSIPSLTSQISLLVKSSALLSIIGFSEFTNLIQSINSQTFENITGYIILAIGYLIITIPLNYLTKKIGGKVYEATN